MLEHARATKNDFWKKMRKSSLIAVLYLLGLVGVVLVISYYFMMNESIRLDEAQSIWQSSHSLGRTLEIVAQDVHVPMYHILLHYWMIIFGTGVEAARAMSMLFFVLSIFVVYLLARTVLSLRWALVLATLFALSPFMNWYANEARMYTLLTFFTLLSQYFFVRILQHKQGWGGYAITAIIGVYSHYFFLFTLLAQAAYYLFNRKKFSAGSFKKFIAVAVGSLLSLVPWIYYFVQQGSADNTRPLLQTPSTVDFFNAFSQFMFGFQTDAVNSIILSAWPLLVVVAFMTVKRKLSIDISVGYLLLAGLLPVVFAFILSFVVTPFFVSRYMMPAVAPLYIVAAWLISRYSKKIAIPMLVVWAMTIGYMFYLQMSSPLNSVREDYKDAATYIEEHATFNDVVALTSPFTVYPFEYSYNGTSQVRTIPLWDRQNEGGIPAFDATKLKSEVDTLISGHDYIYVLASHDQGYEDEVVNYFVQRYEQTHEEKYSEDMTLHVFRVGYNNRPLIEPSRP